MKDNRADKPRRDLDRLTQWLLDPAKTRETPEVYFETLCNELVATGIPLWWASTSIRTMNPEVAVKNVRWKSDTGVESFFRNHTQTGGADYAKSPISEAARTGGPVRVRMADPNEKLKFPITDELAADGATDYLLLRFEMRRGRGFMSFATKEKEGFTQEQVDLLMGLSSVLSARTEILSLEWSLHSLLRTYLGRNASNRVLEGGFQRGTGEKIRAVIWMSDLRGFTQKVDNESIEDVLEALDQYFSCLALPVMEQGGEVLKFIGDAVLGIFPLDKGWPRGACSMALNAAEEAFASMKRLNAERSSRGLSAMDFGLVLHVGEVVYGNIGTTGRLDFTVIGPAVNEASRIEGLCKKLGHPFLVTQDFAQLAERDDLIGLGKHALRGVSHDVDIYTLPAFDVEKSHQLDG